MKNKELSGLVKAIKEKHFVLFVGAGVSVNSGYISWGSLVEEMAKELKIKKIEEVPNGYQMIPEYLYLKSESKYFDILQKNFSDKKNMDNDILDELLEWNPTHIITTNYDRLIEHAVAKAQKKGLCREYDLVACDKQLVTSKKENFLIKMHGDLENREALVLKESDYLSYSQNHVLIEMFVKSLLVNHVFLFVGYGMQDSTLKMIMSWVDELIQSYQSEEFEPIYHYFLSVQNPKKHDRRYFQNKRIHILTSKNVKPAKKVRKHSLTNPLGIELFHLILGCKHYCVQDSMTITSEEMQRYLDCFDEMSFVSFNDIRKVLYPFFTFGVNGFNDVLYLESYECKQHPLYSYLTKNNKQSKQFQKVIGKAGYSYVAYYKGDKEQFIRLPQIPEDEIYRDIIAFQFNGLYEKVFYNNGKMRKDIDAVYCAYVLNIKKRRRHRNLRKLIEISEQEDNYINKLIYEFNLFKDGFKEENFSDRRRMDVIPPGYEAPLKTFEDYYRGMQEKLLEVQQMLLNKLRIATVHSSTVVHYFCDFNPEVLRMQKQVEQVYRYLITNRIYVIHFSAIQYGASEFEQYINTYIEYLLVSQSELVQEHEQYEGGNGDSNTENRLRILDMHLLLYYVSATDLDVMLKKYGIHELACEDNVPSYLIQCIKNIYDTLNIKNMPLNFLMRETKNFIPNLCRCCLFMNYTSGQKHEIIDYLWEILKTVLQQMDEWKYNIYRNNYQALWRCLIALLESSTELYGISGKILCEVINRQNDFENVYFLQILKENRILYYLSYYAKEAKFQVRAEELSEFMEAVLNDVYPEEERIPLLAQISLVMSEENKRNLSEYEVFRGNKRSAGECYFMIMARIREWDENVDNIMRRDCKDFIDRYRQSMLLEQKEAEKEGYQIDKKEDNWMQAELMGDNPFRMLFELRMNGFVNDLRAYKKYSGSDKFWEWFTDPIGYDYINFDFRWCDVLDNLEIVTFLSDKQKTALRDSLKPYIDPERFAEVFVFYYKALV